MGRSFVVLAAVALVGGSAGILSAQQLQPPGRKQALTIQPISTIVGFYSGEYERGISRSATLGIGASYSDGLVGNDDPDNPHYLSVEAKVRYYPGEQPLRGFSLGLTAGYSGITTHECDYSIDFGCGTRTTSRTSGASAGFQLDYGWLLGRSQGTVVALGVGAKRLFVNDNEFSGTVAYPTARISVGFAF